MTIKSIIKLGNKKLATPSLAVDNFSFTSNKADSGSQQATTHATSCQCKERDIEDFYLKDIKGLIKDMQDTMKQKGGVGIAAPQIGCNLRIIMFGFEHSERYPNEKPVPFTILINPLIKILSEEMIEGYEGCLSIPGLRGLVPRYKKIQYSGYDLDGHEISRVVEGFHARVVQHECDHIDGILFPQRIKDMKFFGFEDELKDIIWP